MSRITEIMPPATLTGYVREKLDGYEGSGESLGRYLPAREISATTASFYRGEAGLIQEAQYRAFDAEPEVLAKSGIGKVTIDLHPLGGKIPISEYDQLMLRNASDEVLEKAIKTTGAEVAKAIHRRIERQRAHVLVYGIATDAKVGFHDDFGRRPDHTITLANLWTDPSVSRIDDLRRLYELYEENNGAAPGVMLVSSRVQTLLGRGVEFRPQMQNGISRPATPQDVLDILSAYGLPPIEVYNRRGANQQRYIPDNMFLFLPAAGSEDSADVTPLGNTFWGQTLSATAGDFGLEPGEAPGVVAAVHANDRMPFNAEVESDAFGLPVLANADLSMAVTVA